MQYTITGASSSITSSRRRSWQTRRIALDAQSAKFQPLHAPSVHAGSEHVVVIYHTCIQHVSNMYPTCINRIIHVSHICITHVSVRIRVDLGIAYHACISAYQERFQKAYVSCVYLHVSRVSGMVCIRIHVSFMYLCVSACITHCVSHNVSSVLYRMYPVYIVNLYHNGWKCQKMRIFF
jgi:hypothetical protein